MDEHKTLIEKKQEMRFFLTGTQVYGPVNKSSDLDIAIHFEDAYYLEEFLIGHNIELIQSSDVHKDATYVGFHFDLAGIPVNVIVLRDDEYYDWRIRTEKMKKLPPVEDKGERIATFNED